MLEHVSEGKEALHSSEQIDFEVKQNIVECALKEKKTCFEGKRSMLEQRFRALSGFQARSISDFERSVASKEKETCSSSDFERSVACRSYKKQARAMISSARWLRSTLEQ